MIPKYLIDEYYKFHVYNAGIYFKKFTAEEARGNTSWINHVVNNLGTSKYSYHTLQFFYPEKEPVVSKLAIIYVVYAANDLAEIERGFDGDFETVRELKKSPSIYKVFDQFELGGLDNEICYKDHENKISITSEAFGLNLNVDIQMGNQPKIKGRFRLLASERFNISPHAVFHPTTK